MSTTPDPLDRRQREERLRFETLLADLSARFINLPANQVDAEIEAAQQQLCEHLDLDVCVLWQLSKDHPDSLALTHVFLASGLPPVPEKMDARERIPWSLEKLHRGETIVLSRMADAPAAAARDVQLWQRFGIKSVVFLPLRAGGKTLFGALSLDALRAERDWSPELVSRLELVGQVFANALARKWADQALRESQELLQEHLRLERFLSQSATTFLSLPIHEVDGALQDALRGLVELLGVDRVLIARVGAGGTSLAVTHSHSTPGLPLLELNVDVGLARPWHKAQIISGRALVLSHLPDDLPAEAIEERAYAIATGLKSHLALPMKAGGEIIGELAVACFRERREFSAEFLGRLELLASTFASALHRRASEERLQAAEALSRSVLTSVASEIVVLDQAGRIVAVNKAWEMSARRERFPLSSVPLGADYFEILGQLPSGGVNGATAARRAGIRSVLCGERERYEIAYPYPHSSGTLHYLLCATRLSGPTGGAVVVHTDVTALERAKEDLERAKADIERALEQVRELKERFEAENVVLQQEIRRSGDFEEIVGRSPALAALLEQVRHVAATDAPVLVLGETGTGKDLVARAVHDSSSRRDRPLVTVNCAALPAALIESELFGYEKGAFTGAINRTPGRFEVANGGTILLDEVGELPLEVQAKLLRVVQTGHFERLGSSKTLRSDARLIAATNRDLQREVREGRFRADLFYRLSVFPLTLPPLRNRPDDIPLLVWHFIGRKQNRLGRHIERVPERLLQAFRAHAWPGNIRELENVVERALILSTGTTLAIDPMFAGGRRDRPLPAAGLLSDVERRHILDVLEQCAWRVAGKGNAAERLGLNRSTLQSRMQKLGISRPRR